MTFLSRIYMTLFAAVLLAFGGWLMSDSSHLDSFGTALRDFAKARAQSPAMLAPQASEPYAPQVVYLKDKGK